MKKPSKSIQDKFYKNLYENYEELSEFLTSALDSQYRDMEEMRYLSEFIRYKNREEEYAYFRENAHEVSRRDMPFSILTL
jgi:hypothetical protein